MKKQTTKIDLFKEHKMSKSQIKRLIEFAEKEILEYQEFIKELKERLKQ